MAAPIEILITEDDPGNVKLIMLALDGCHLAGRVLIVRDGVELLEYLQRTGAFADRRPDDLPKLIMLDLKLPRMDGLEVLKRIKEDDKLRMIPVVVLTSSSAERDLIESYRLGVNSYIVKPLELDEFQQSVRQMAQYWVHLNQSPAGQ